MGRVDRWRRRRGARRSVMYGASRTAPWTMAASAPRAMMRAERMSPMMPAVGTPRASMQMMSPGCERLDQHDFRRDPARGRVVRLQARAASGSGRCAHGRRGGCRARAAAAAAGRACRCCASQGDQQLAGGGGTDLCQWLADRRKSGILLRTPCETAHAAPHPFSSRIE